MKRFISKMPFTVLAIVAVVLLVNYTGYGVDDSDRDGWHRSGVSVITDHKTGLQYLSTWTGGITPRLAPDGTQLRASPSPANRKD
jgi:hypothetical protein